MAKNLTKKSPVKPEVSIRSTKVQKSEAIKEIFQKKILRIYHIVSLELQKPFLIILFFLICLFLFLKLFGPMPFTLTDEQTKRNNLFIVQATAKMTQIPNTAKVSFAVTKTAPTVLDAQNQT